MSEKATQNSMILRFMQNYGGSYCIEKVEEIGEFKSNDTRDITSLYRFSKKQ